MLTVVCDKCKKQADGGGGSYHEYKEFVEATPRAEGRHIRNLHLCLPCVDWFKRWLAE